MGGTSTGISSGLGVLANRLPQQTSTSNTQMSYSPSGSKGSKFDVSKDILDKARQGIGGGTGMEGGIDESGRRYEYGPGFGGAVKYYPDEQVTPRPFIRPEGFPNLPSYDGAVSPENSKANLDKIFDRLKNPLNPKYVEERRKYFESNPVRLYNEGVATIPEPVQTLDVSFPKTAELAPDELQVGGTENVKDFQNAYNNINNSSNSKGNRYQTASPIPLPQVPNQIMPNQPQPMQQPFYQQPMQQPFYQQPMQQPFYQQPMQQPFYQQPYMQQPYMQQPFGGMPMVNRYPQSQPFSFGPNYNF